MIDQILAKLAEERAAATVAAEALLLDRGFAPEGDRQWQGWLDADEHGTVSINVSLPPTFPDVLPEVRVDRSTLVRRIPHVDQDGKICLGPNTGLLLDTANPRGVMHEALLRAQNEIVAGLSGTNQEHFIDEFVAYWSRGAAGRILSICAPRGPSRCLYQVTLVKDHTSQSEETLIAEDFEAAKAWAINTGKRIQYGRRAFFIQVRSAFMPPDFGTTLTVGDVLTTIRDSTRQGYYLFKTWLNKNKLPAIVILSLPLKSEQGQILIAVRFERAAERAATHVQRGYRPGKVPIERELSCTYNNPVTRLHVERWDAAYLLARGGGAEQLFTRTIAVVGCGAVGSHIVERLTSLGVGKLRLIDPDNLAADNVQRHSLGVASIGINKAVGLKTEFGRRFPHLAIEVRSQPIEDVLQTEPAFLLDADLIIIAVGDETLELRLNDMLRSSKPRLHVWVEPLGIGGHILATGIRSAPGCFRCLFAHDPQLGLHNQAAFAALGQTFQRSYAGCAGVFTPFAGIDADRAALEAALLASRILLGQETENVLISWRGDPTAFVQAGFKLSQRTKIIAVGTQHRETNYIRADCLGCGKGNDAVSSSE